MGSQTRVAMQLRLDLTSDQAFFTRVGPGKAKHLSTRLLWTQQAMRRQWFEVFRISTKENPADLNTKALSRERREFLMKRIGLVSEVFGGDEEIPYQGQKRQLVKLLVNMIMASNLQGCGEELWHGQVRQKHWRNRWNWVPNNKMAFEVGGVCDSLHGHCDASNLVQVDGEDGEDRELQESNSADSRDCPFCTSGSQGEVLYCEELDGDPFAEHHEEEEPSPDETVADGEAEDPLNAMGLTSAGSINGDVEAVGVRRVLQAEGAHGAADGDEARVPDEGGADDGREADDEDESFEVEETPAERYQRYLQSTKGEVSDPDELGGDALRFWDAR
jgi:hypothetical protein